MGYTAVPTVSPGDLWTAANHNTYIRDNFAYFATPDVAIYRAGATQSINNAQMTVVNFGTQIQDPLSRVTTGAAWKFTAGYTGYYLVLASIAFSLASNWDAGDRIRLYITKNGSTYNASMTVVNSTGVNDYAGAQVSGLVQLNAAEYCGVSIYQESGGAQTLHISGAYEFSQISIARLY